MVKMVNFVFCIFHPHPPPHTPTHLTLAAEGRWDTGKLVRDAGLGCMWTGYQWLVRSAWLLYGVEAELFRAVG